MIPENTLSQQLDESIKAAREGDLAAFEHIVTTFERPLFGYVSRMISVREDAEDAVQEIFIKVYKKLGTYDAAQSFKTWLYTIATNTVYDFLRARRVKKELLIFDESRVDEDGESVQGGQFETADPSSTYDMIEARFDVAAGLTLVRPAYRTILLLYYKEDLSCEQISAALGIPVGTVKTNLFRARKALKDALGTNY